jgi:hypothetical protein
MEENWRFRTTNAPHRVLGQKSKRDYEPLATSLMLSFQIGEPLSVLICVVGWSESCGGGLMLAAPNGALALVFMPSRLVDVIHGVVASSLVPLALWPVAPIEVSLLSPPKAQTVLAIKAQYVRNEQIKRCRC